MKKLIVNEETWELEEIEVSDIKKESNENTSEFTLKNYLGCDPEEFIAKYKSYKQAKTDFDILFERAKNNLLELYENGVEDGFPFTISIGEGVKLTYVRQSMRTSIDNKKLKEEEPEIAKKYTKYTIVNPTIRIS